MPFLRPPFLLASLALTGPVLPTASLPAQAPADRFFLDSLTSQLRAASSLSDLPAPNHCAAREGSLSRLCQGLLLLRRGDFTNAGGDATAAVALLERVVAEQPRWPMAWFGLGMGRMAVARAGLLAREGPLLPVGISNEAGAAAAVVRALELDSTSALMANTLAMLPIPREGASRLGERIDAQRRVRRLLTPPALYAAGNVELEAGNTDSALSFYHAALAHGVGDPGLVRLAMARAWYRTGRPDSGRMALFAGAADSAPVSVRAYRNELSWVATPQELARWDSLNVAERPGFIAAFWSRRDVLEGRGDGERLIEHYRRIEFALRNYSLRLPETGRQVSLTTSTSVEYADEYEARKLALRGNRFAPAATASGGRINPNAPQPGGEAAPTLSRILSYSRLVGADPSVPYYTPVQTQVDDRGVAYIRHGPPDRIARTTGGESVEVWRYEMPGGPMVLQFREIDFDGSVGAGTLVPTLISLPAPLRAQVCHLETALCPASNRISAFRGQPEYVLGLLEKEAVAEGALLGTDAIARAVDAGRKVIDLATTTDTYHRDFTHAVKPTVQLVGLDRAAGGEPRLVIAFAIPGDQLAGSPLDGRTIYPVHFQVMALDLRTSKRTDLDTLRQFAAAKPLADGQFISGILELPVPGGTYSVSLVMTQADGRGAVAHLGEVVVPGVSPKLAVSDLVLGREGSGVHWNSGATMVPLNPLNAYPKGGTAEIYFQLSGLTAGTSYQTTFEFFRSDDDPKRAPRLRIASSQIATLSRQEIQRSLGLQHLDPARYRVQLTVTGHGETVKSVAWLTVVK